MMLLREQRGGYMTETDIGVYEVGRAAMPYIKRCLERTIDKQFPELDKPERELILEHMNKVISEALFH